jgi:hypothetical protein
VLVLGSFEKSVYIKFREMNMFWFDLTNFNDFFGFDDYGVGCLYAMLVTSMDF